MTHIVERPIPVLLMGIVGGDLGGAIFGGLVGVLWICLCLMVGGSLILGLGKRGGLPLVGVVILVLVIVMVAAVLFLLVMTLVRVEVRASWWEGPWLSPGGLGGPRNHCEDVCRGSGGSEFFLWGLWGSCGFFFV